MARWPDTVRGPLVLLTTIVALPAAALVFLGVRLLQQDRALERQRRAEILDEASDRAVNGLTRDLAVLMRTLADPSWPSTAPAPGSVQIAFSRDGIRVEPPGAIAYWPGGAALPEAPDAAFREIDQAELAARDLPTALARAQALGASTNDAVMAGALMRKARILRKLGRAGDALAAYGELARFTTVAINGLPADLQARKTRCALLAEQSRASDLTREAAALETDLAAGRWRVDRGSFEYLRSLLAEWRGTATALPPDREALAEAVGWMHAQWTELPLSLPAGGARVLADSGVMVAWSWTDGRLGAIAGTPSYVAREWGSRAQPSSAPAFVTLTAPGAVHASQPRDVETIVSIRSPADTGLPWTVVATFPSGVDPGQFEGRRRTLLTALGFVFVLVAAGGYVVVRARNREMTLARLQYDFVTAVSHEFRTPLTTLLQFNALLEEDGEVGPEQRRAYYQAQRRATERLRHLVESLLDFGRMEAGKRRYALERLDAGLLVRDVVDEFREELSGRDVALRCAADDGDHVVEADPEAFALAVRNLLDNAVKYSGDRPEIDVTIARCGERVAIAVRDHGIGIPANEQGRVFQKFTRGAAAIQQRIKGTGIGLAMVQHIVTGHRGSLQVQSVEHAGSTFTIELPADQAVLTNPDCTDVTVGS